MSRKLSRENNEGFQRNKKSTTKLVGIGIVTGMALACAIYGAIIGVKSLVAPKTKGIPIEEYMGDTKIAAKKLDNAEKNELVTRAKQSIDTMRSGNAYINVQDGEDTYVSLLYNKNGECIAQASESGYITVYRNDHKAIRYTDYIDYGYDSEILSMLSYVIDMSVNGKTEVYGVTDEDEIEGYTQIIMDLRGKEAIAEMYSYYDKDFSDVMIEQLNIAIQEASASENSNISENDSINFRYVLAMNDETNTIDSTACYIYFGDKEGDRVTWGEISTSWAYSGFSMVYDWELGEDWYNDKWETISEWESLDEAEKLLEDTYSEVIDMLNQWAEDNGQESLLDDSETSDEDTEETEKSTDEDGISIETGDIDWDFSDMEKMDEDNQADKNNDANGNNKTSESEVIE